MKIYTKNNTIVKRNIHDITFLIDISDNYLDEKCRLYEINQMGSIIWDLLDYEHINQTEIISKRIKDMIIDDVPIEVIWDDVSAFITLMNSEGFIKEVDNGRAE